MTDKMVLERAPYEDRVAETRHETPFMKKLPKTGVLETDQATIEKYFPEHLQNQLDDTMQLYRKYNEKLPESLQRSERDFTFIEHFYASFLLDRNRRAADIEQERYQQIIEKARTILPARTFFVLCMDGRVKIIHTNGLSADTASAIRTPGGMLDEFIRIDGQLTLQENSPFAKMLIDSSQKGTCISQVFDSHYTCAARKGEEAATGHYPSDSGLFRDVIYKKEMAQAAKKFLQENSDCKNVSFFQTTFNPVTGYLYMGLERDEAQQFAQDKAKQKALREGRDVERAAKHAEYSKEILKELITDGRIISTGQLITDEKIRAAFDRESFDIDRINKYVESAEKFWNKIEILWGELLPTLKEKLLKIYPDLASDQENSNEELEERAILLLTNAFNTYLVNRKHNEMQYLDMDDHEYEKMGHYLFGVHNEAGVKVSEGGHPPYEIPMFVIYSNDIENLSERIELSSKLVRLNRIEGRVKDASGQFIDPDEFGEAPVCLVMQEIVRDADNLSINNVDWKKLEKINWDDMPKDWDISDDEEFRKYLVAKGIGDVLLTDGILRLRKKMARIYDPSQETATHLRDLYKTVLPIICNDHRKTHAIIPFLKVARKDTNGQKIAA